MQLIYGIHAVLELLRSDPGKIEKLWLAEDAGNRRLKDLAAEAKSRNVVVHFEPKEALSRRAGSDRHQGVVAAIAAAPVLDDDAALDRCGDNALLLVLDGIMDPQNLGAILRTAEGAGVGAVFLPERRTAPLSPAVIQASAGAAHHLRIARIGNVSYFLEKLQQRGYRVIGLDADASLDWCAGDLTGPLALVFGSEGEGLRRLVKEHCDALVRLPMLGKVESLNVSAAAAAVLFECVRQRKS